MTYFINPIWFYWMSVCEGVKQTAIGFAIVTGLCLIGTGVAYLYENTESILYDHDSDKQYAKLWGKCAKWALIAFIPLVLVALFSPNKEALIEMQVASLATKTNVEWTAEQLKSVVDYIIECIKSLK